MKGFQEGLPLEEAMQHAGGNARRMVAGPGTGGVGAVPFGDADASARR